MPDAIREIYIMMLTLDGHAKLYSAGHLVIWSEEGHYLRQEHFLIDYDKGCIEKMDIEEMISHK